MEQGLLAWGIERMGFAPPVILYLCRVNIRACVLIVIQCERGIKVVDKKVALSPLQRRHEGMTVAVFLAVNRFLAHARLYLPILLRITQSEHQAVCPGAPNPPYFCSYCLIVVGVVEALHALQVGAVNASRFKILNGHIHLIIVVRIILICRKFIRKSARKGMRKGGVCAVCVKRTIGIGSVELPSPGALAGDDVYHSVRQILRECCRWQTNFQRLLEGRRQQIF